MKTSITIFLSVLCIALAGCRTMPMDCMATLSLKIREIDGMTPVDLLEWRVPAQSVFSCSIVKPNARSDEMIYIGGNTPKEWRDLETGNEVVVRLDLSRCTLFQTDNLTAAKPWIDEALPHQTRQLLWALAVKSVSSGHWVLFEDTRLVKTSTKNTQHQPAP